MKNVSSFSANVRLEGAQQRHSARKHPAIIGAPKVYNVGAFILELTFSLRVIARVRPTAYRHGMPGLSLRQRQEPDNFLQATVVQVRH